RHFNQALQPAVCCHLGRLFVKSTSSGRCLPLLETGGFLALLCNRILVVRLLIVTAPATNGALSSPLYGAVLSPAGTLAEADWGARSWSLDHSSSAPGCEVATGFVPEPRGPTWRCMRLRWLMSLLDGGEHDSVLYSRYLPGQRKPASCLPPSSGRRAGQLGEPSAGGATLHLGKDGNTLACPSSFSVLRFCTSAAYHGPTRSPRDKIPRTATNEEDRDTMSDEREARIHKLDELRAAGIDPYPTESHRTHTAAEAIADFDELQAAGTRITLVGRIMKLREMKAAFADIEDRSGHIQIYIKRDSVGDEAFRRLKLIDLGDFIEASGILFTTKTGEKTLQVDEYRLLAKALVPLPAKGAGGDLKLFDPELRQRKRYLDLIANREEVVPIFVARAKTLQAMRDFLTARGF